MDGLKLWPNKQKARPHFLNENDQLSISKFYQRNKLISELYVLQVNHIDILYEFYDIQLWHQLIPVHLLCIFTRFCLSYWPLSCIVSSRLR
jgi:hypothetical protein